MTKPYTCRVDTGVRVCVLMMGRWCGRRWYIHDLLSLLGMARRGPNGGDCAWGKGGIWARARGGQKGEWGACAHVECGACRREQKKKRDKIMHAHEGTVAAGRQVCKRATHPRSTHQVVATRSRRERTHWQNRRCAQMIRRTGERACGQACQ
jgi:hypothetical protein